MTNTDYSDSESPESRLWRQRSWRRVWCGERADLRRGVGLHRVLRLSVSTWRHGTAWRGGLAPGVYLDRVLTGPSHRTAAQRSAPHRTASTLWQLYKHIHNRSLVSGVWPAPTFITEPLPSRRRRRSPFPPSLFSVSCPRRQINDWTLHYTHWYVKWNMCLLALSYRFRLEILM